jgi:hypothetical protein
VKSKAALAFGRGHLEAHYQGHSLALTQHLHRVYISIDTGGNAVDKKARTSTLREKLIRWGGIAGVIAGAAFMTSGLLGFIGSDTFLGWFGSDSLFHISALYDRMQGLDFRVQAVAVTAGLVLMLCVLGAVHVQQSAGSDVLGKFGLFVSLAGVILLLFGILMASLSSAYLAGWIPVFSWEWYVALLVFMVGLPVVGLGLVVSIIATVRARVLPGWARYGFAALLTVTLLAFIVDFLLGSAHDVVENSYIEGNRSLGSYTEISSTLGMVGDILGLTEGILFGLAWVVVGLALLAPAAANEPASGVISKEP